MEELWRLVRPRLERALRARGLSVQAAEDAAQEAGLKAWSMGLHFADAEALLRWAIVVASRAAIDAHRKTKRVVLGVEADTATHEDVEDSVERRMELREVGALLMRMRPIDREALRATARTRAAGDRRERIRDAVRLHRARARLRELVDGAAGWFGLRHLRMARGLATAGVSVCFAAQLFVLLQVGPAQVRPPATRSAVTASTAPVRPAVRSDDQPRQAGSSPPVAPSRGGAERQLPSVAVIVERPDGTRLRIVGRPKRPDDHVLCADTILLGYRCADGPAELVPER